MDLLYAWWGDGFCDDGVDSPADFSCAALDWDLGDCPVGDAETGMAGSSCMADTPEGMVEGTTDCSGDCIGVPMEVMEYWVGDGTCDDGTGSGSSTYVNLLCEAFSYDGDDCF